MMEKATLNNKKQNRLLVLNEALAGRATGQVRLNTIYRLLNQGRFELF